LPRATSLFDRALVGLDEELTRFGLLPPLEGAVSGGTPSVELVYRMAEMVEELRYDSIWVGDRLLLTPGQDPPNSSGRNRG